MNCRKNATNCRICEMKCQAPLHNRAIFANFGRQMGKMLKLKNINVGWIIHIFALLHAVVALACRLGGINDELLLTVLTMTMVLLICMKKWISIEYAASCVIVANVLGYLLGHFGAKLLQSVIGATPTVNAVSTVVTTEILGWTIMLFTRFFHSKETEKKGISLFSPQMQWVLAAMAGIFIFRIGIVFLLSTEAFENADIIGAVARVFSNSAVVMIMLALNVIFIRWQDSRSDKQSGTTSKALTTIGFVLGATFTQILILGSISPLGLKSVFSKDFPILFLTSMLAQITVYCIVFMVNYAIKARSEAKKAMGMANIAEYRYFKLKHQVNPHFLFNSLNILDCLVCEEKTEQASTYIHKLAGLYRYMLKTEEEKLVSLEEELEFAGRYYDLLKVRFPQGLELEVSVPEGYRSRYVIPCALQLLIENATKHNAINASNPLTIIIKAENDSVTVCNRIISKISTSPSTGLGLKYMKQQYLDISGKTVEIEHTEEIFSVTIPLL